MEVFDELERLKAENAKLKDRIVEYDEFANERALSAFDKDEEIDKLKEQLILSESHNYCKICGKTLEGESKC